MARIIADRVLETSTTTGTGTYTLAGAVAGFRAASGAPGPTLCANGDTFTYYAEDVDAFGRPTGGWETGLGTWGTGNTLARTIIYASSNAGAAVNWTGAPRRIAMCIVASDVANYAPIDSPIFTNATNSLVYSSGQNGWGGFYSKGSGTNNSYYFFGNATSGETGQIVSQNNGTLTFAYGTAATSSLMIYPTASAVNYLQIAPGATGSAVSLNSKGTDTNVGFSIYPKGTGLFGVGGSTSITGSVQAYALTTPSAPAGVPSTTGGTIPAGTQYAKIVARDGLSGQGHASAQSTAVTTTGATSSIVWTWPSVVGAASYLVFVGTTNGQVNYFVATTNSYTQTIPYASGTVGVVPVSDKTGGASFNGSIGTAWYVNCAYVNMSHTASGSTTDTIFYSSADSFIRKNTATGLKTSLALHNVTNESKATMFASPIFTGAVTAPTLKIGSSREEYRANFEWGATPEWRKLATITESAVQYASTRFEILISDAITNIGGSNADTTRSVYHVTTCRNGLTVNDTPDTCYISGPSVNTVRAVKTAVGVYEIQVGSTTAWRQLQATIRVIADNSSSTVVYSDGSVAGATTGTIYTAVDGTDGLELLPNVSTRTLTSRVATGTAPLTVASTTKVANLNVDLLDDYSLDRIVAGLRSNYNITGGGTITVNASAYIIWSTRFIVMGNGRGAHFSTSGYFDITCPTSGTITGVGGSADVTATAAGIPLGSWQALYYILPIGSGSASVAANFRMVLYTGALEIPSDWVLVCLYNPESSTYNFHRGITLKINSSFNTATGYATSDSAIAMAIALG